MSISSIENITKYTRIGLERKEVKFDIPLFQKTTRIVNSGARGLCLRDKKGTVYKIKDVTNKHIKRFLQKLAKNSA